MTPPHRFMNVHERRHGAFCRDFNLTDQHWLNADTVCCIRAQAAIARRIISHLLPIKYARQVFSA